jgi:hypothetical protein
MSGLKEAVERLARAVDRLESIAERQRAGTAALEAELARIGSAPVPPLDGSVAERLDAAIEQLQAVLET